MSKFIPSTLSAVGIDIEDNLQIIYEGKGVNFTTEQKSILFLGTSGAYWDEKN